MLGAGRVVVRCGVARRSAGAIALNSAVDEPCQVRCFICRVIDQELEPRCMPQAQATSYLTSQEPARARKSLTHLLRRAGTELPLFEPAAVETLFQASKGLPRKINLLAHHGLIAAAVAKARTVTADHVAAALAEVT